jgi:predicted unusual protein kinase regulating ubiquinone biosynthesis (AarF/ABC1/UbiB family)
MGKDWSELGGDRGKKIETGRLVRALKLGGIATRMTGSVIRRKLKHLAQSDNDKVEALAGAALENAQQLVEVMGQMKGAAMKVGQILSSDPDLVHPEFARRLASLQRQAPPMDFGTLSAQVERSLDQPIDAVFKYFDPEPIGAASIGQVHRATLFDGREVAVKIQYPGIADSIESDLENMGSLLKLGRVLMTRERADDILVEAREAILQEADYLAEAKNLSRFRELFSEWEGVRIPEPIHELTRGQLLVMEFVEGVPFDEGLNAIPDPVERNAIAKRFVSLFVHMFHELQLLHADPHPGNFLLDDENNIVLLDFGCVREFDEKVADGILELLVAYWADDVDRMKTVYREQGYGSPNMSMPSNEQLRRYHRMILEPMTHDAPFRFSEFQVHGRVRSFLKDNLGILKLVPPAELLLYFRVVAGIKGMMTRLDAEVNVYAMAQEACRQRSLL